MKADTDVRRGRRARVHRSSCCEAGTPLGSAELSALELSTAERAAAEAYSELRAKVVHAFNNDLRTPLTVLLCHTELLLETGEMPESARSSLEAMRRAGRAIRTRLTDLATSVDEHDHDGREGREGREGPGDEPAGRAQVHLASLLADVVGGIGRVPGADISLTTSATEDLSVDVYPALLRRAVVELLHNALSHAPQGSTVRLSCRIEADQVCIEVRDEGPGISERERARAAAWAPAADDPSRLRGGGLAVASLVAAAHSGRLVLENRSGGGLSATLRLDLHAISAL